jgi:uncharacterized membrane protein YkgB
MKFTAYEAAGIEPFVANSPLMSWLYALLSVRGVSNLLGVVEIATAVLILLRPLSPLPAAIGGAIAAGTFLTTLTVLVSTPGWEPSLGGFPALSALPGQFLVKDVVLLGASLQVLGDALSALRERNPIRGSCLRFTERLQAPEVVLGSLPDGIDDKGCRCSSAIRTRSICRVSRSSSSRRAERAKVTA